MSSLLGAPAAAVSLPANSQTAPLLAAALASDPLGGLGGGDTTIVGGALLADAGPVGTAADIESTPHSDRIATYVVRRGDTISDIAKMYNVSVNTIIWANNLKRGAGLKEGDTLVILPISGVRYTVRSGDTLAAIGKKFKTDPEEIAQFNGLDQSDGLAKGAVIIVPDADGTLAYDADAPKENTKRKMALKAPKLNIRLANHDEEDHSNENGYFVRPLAGGVRTQGIHGNNGIDIASSIGTPIRAAAAGTVIIARDSAYNGGYGKYVVVEHANGTQTLYAHLDEVNTNIGARVGQGELIGTLGNTGRSTGPHLHFEVRGGKNPF